MDIGLDIAATGMVAEQARQDQLSNDLANASTPGFKPDETPQHSFGAILLANTEGGEAVGSVDEGVALGKTYTNMTLAGTMQETGEPLDFAIVGSGFFAVKTAAGTRYTRDGQFTVSSKGVLTDTNGNPVLERERRTDQGQRHRHRPGERGRRLRSARRRQAGRKPLHRQGRRQTDRHRPPGLARGLGRGRRQDDDRNDHLDAQLPIRAAGDPGDQPDVAGGLLAGRLAEPQRLTAAALTHAGRHGG